MIRFIIPFAVCATLATLDASSVLAKIGDIEIQTEEIREMIAGLDAAQQAAIAKDPSALNQYVRALLVQRLILKQAIDQKWDQEPAVITKLVRARESALTESYLQNVSALDAAYPSPNELTSAYESAKPKLLIPRTFRLAQIYIASDQAKLDAVTKQLKAKNADFAAIARSSSEETTSAAQGGEIGWLTEDQIQPDIREKLPKLTLGTVSDPIKLKDGWHILKVLDIREPRTPTLDEI
ncbi:MAG: peptidylprolyl isomerase, partial [Gloeobacteraceae cyanobacterium ES-bin-144]|nr:peptidylprolyl isomerase [Verrucomicrobiales bacterium]